MIAFDQVADRNPARPGGHRRFVAVDDIPCIVGIILVIVEIFGKCAPAEPSFSHALEHDCGGDRWLQCIIGMPFQGIVGEQFEFVIGPGIIVSPGQLHETSAVIGLTGLGIGHAIGPAGTIAVF
ncbi:MULTISPECIES: hypothetical protein [Microvirga]|uniref:hypothetical protein n=1 Tax=Microvirga TaxID=186650 RepID=UPI001FFDABEF|nr:MULTISPECIES: hypothetical protein [unclassified Microvirga]